MCVYLHVCAFAARVNTTMHVPPAMEESLENFRRAREEGMSAVAVAALPFAVPHIVLVVLVVLAPAQTRRDQERQMITVRVATIEDVAAANHTIKVGAVAHDFADFSKAACKFRVRAMWRCLAALHATLNTCRAPQINQYESLGSLNKRVAAELLVPVNRVRVWGCVYTISNTVRPCFPIDGITVEEVRRSARDDTVKCPTSVRALRSLLNDSMPTMEAVLLYVGVVAAGTRGVFACMRTAALLGAARDAGSLPRCRDAANSPCVRRLRLQVRGGVAGHVGHRTEARRGHRASGPRGAVRGPAVRGGLRARQLGGGVAQAIRWLHAATVPCAAGSPHCH